jgi:hypothetical protein
MANFIKGASLRELLFGQQVIKLAQTPPASTASANLFTVAGGAVLVTSLLGQVSTILSGSTGAIALGTAPTVGTAETGGISTAGVIGGAEVGSWVSASKAITGLAGAVQANLFAGNGIGICPAFVVNTGYITVTTSVLTMTGAIDWYVSYVPLNSGASIS